MTGEIIGDISKSNGQMIRVAWAEWEGHEYLDVRTFFDAGGEEYRATRKGVTIPPALVPDLIECLRRAVAARGGE